MFIHLCVRARERSVCQKLFFLIKIFKLKVVTAYECRHFVVRYFKFGYNLYRNCKIYEMLTETSFVLKSKI